MRKYPIVVILWEDHTQIIRSEMVKNPDEFLKPTLTVGILYKETDKSLILVSDIERYSSRDDATYFIILKSTIISRKDYGKIKLAKIRSG